YSSTDWDFIQTRSDMHGYVVTVDDAKVTVGKPKVSSGPVLTLTYGLDIIKMDLELDAKGQLKKVEAEGWDMSTNKIVNVVAAEPAVPSQGNVKGPDISDVIGGGTLQLKSTGPIDRDMLQSWADSKLQRSRLSRVRGKIIFQGHAAAKPNTTVELKGVGERFNGNAYVSGVYHRLKEFDWDTEVTIGLAPQNFAESQKDIQTPPASGMLPAVHGLQIGTVKKIDADPQGETRILVDIPILIETGDGVWARQAAYYATKEAGNFFQPEIGDEVVMGFLNDDIRYPIILGSVYSKTHMPAYTPDEPNTYKAIVTNSKMKIEFEDIKRIMTLETPNGNTMIYSDDEGSITIEDENKNKIVMDAKGINIYTPIDLIIKADGLISMEAMKTIDIKATQDLTEEGLNVTSKASAANTMKGATAEVNGSATTTIKGGVVMIN
ncbi:MAG TPA: type VI secretion system tip protein VgrG, partial [Bacteroidetes bacterium]|nr:type VI secretion system tip protein VgrG [Bacteroidota bacterium]